MPDDVQALVQLGMSPSLVFRLMGIATRHGKRLADIVAARLDAIRAARQPIGLVMKLARDAVDYGEVARRAAAVAVRQAAAKAEQHQRSSLRTEHEGQWLQTRGDRVVFVRPGGLPEVYVPLPCGRWRFSHALAGPVLERFWGDLKAAAWRCIGAPQIVL